MSINMLPPSFIKQIAPFGRAFSMAYELLPISHAMTGVIALQNIHLRQQK
jgi:hypothetical protein